MADDCSKAAEVPTSSDAHRMDRLARRALLPVVRPLMDDRRLAQVLAILTLVLGLPVRYSTVAFLALLPARSHPREAIRHGIRRSPSWDLCNN